MLQDIRFALRQWAKSPAFAIIAIVALALGIGANTALFSVVDAVLLRSPPYPQADRIVQVERDFHGGRGLSASVPDFLDWRASGVFANLAALDPLPSGFNLAGAGRPIRLPGLHVTANFFSVLGVQPALGRGFAANEDQPGQPPVAILSHRAWRDHFGGEAGVIGRAVTLNDKQYTIIGVLPAKFHFEPDVDVYAPLDLSTELAATDRGAHIPEAIGRLRPGLTLAGARAQMDALAARLRRSYPDAEGGAGIALVPLRRQWSGEVRPELLILLGAVALVLLIACANVANLLLARASARGKEMALRAALGAGRGRLVRQMLTESVLLGLLGGALGLALAAAGARALVALSPAALPRVNAIGLNGPVLIFTLAVALLTGVLFGLVPALAGSRASLDRLLREDSARAGAGSRQRRARGALVAAEVALAVVLLIGAGLLISSFARLRAVRPGFAPEHALALRVALSPGRYATTAAVANYFRATLARARAVPGVTAAGAGFDLPLGPCPDLLFTVVGRPAPARANQPDAYYHVITPGFFAGLGVRLLNGRDFSAADSAQAPPVVIINSAARQRWWPRQNPVGQAIWIGRGEPDGDSAPRVIVGVVNEVKQDGLDDKGLEPAIYIPLPQAPSDLVATLVRLLPPFVVVRGAGDAGALATPVERALWSVDGDQPIFAVQKLPARIAASTAGPAFDMTLLGVFAALAIVLAGVGVYGVISYSVSQRRREIGVRMALGADAPAIRRLIVGGALRLALLGAAAGLVAAGLLTRLMSSLLFGVRSWDPATFILAALLVLVAAAAASWWPARRAAATSPLVALRGD